MENLDWGTCSDPYSMLESLRQSGRLTQRKWRLFAVACCRRVNHLIVDERSRRAVEVAEAYADGKTTAEDLADAYDKAFDAGAELAERCIRDPVAFEAAGLEPFRSAAWPACSAAHEDESADGTASQAASALPDAAEEVAQADILRYMFPAPALLVNLNLKDCCLTTELRAYSESIYVNRAFGLLPRLADKLQSSGCHVPAMLAHCRCGGPHVPGCWVVDLLTGRS